MVVTSWTYNHRCSMAWHRKLNVHPKSHYIWTQLLHNTFAQATRETDCNPHPVWQACSSGDNVWLFNPISIIIAISKLCRNPISVSGASTGYRYCALLWKSQQMGSHHPTPRQTPRRYHSSPSPFANFMEPLAAGTRQKDFTAKKCKKINILLYFQD